MSREWKQPPAQLRRDGSVVPGAELPARCAAVQGRELSVPQAVLEQMAPLLTEARQAQQVWQRQGVELAALVAETVRQPSAQDREALPRFSGCGAGDVSTTVADCAPAAGAEGCCSSSATLRRQLFQFVEFSFKADNVVEALVGFLLIAAPHQPLAEAKLPAGKSRIPRWHFRGGVRWKIWADQPIREFYQFALHVDLFPRGSVALQ